MKVYRTISSLAIAITLSLGLTGAVQAGCVDNYPTPAKNVSTTYDAAGNMTLYIQTTDGDTNGHTTVRLYDQYSNKVAENNGVTNAGWLVYTIRKGTGYYYAYGNDVNSCNQTVRQVFLGRIN